MRFGAVFADSRYFRGARLAKNRRKEFVVRFAFVAGSGEVSSTERAGINFVVCVRILGLENTGSRCQIVVEGNVAGPKSFQLSVCP